MDPLAGLEWSLQREELTTVVVGKASPLIRHAVDGHDS